MSIINYTIIDCGNQVVKDALKGWTRLKSHRSGYLTVEDYTQKDINTALYELISFVHYYEYFKECVIDQDNIQVQKKFNTKSGLYEDCDIEMPEFSWMQTCNTSMYLGEDYDSIVPLIMSIDSKFNKDNETSKRLKVIEDLVMKKCKDAIETIPLAIIVKNSI